MTGIRHARAPPLIGIEALIGVRGIFSKSSVKKLEIVTKAFAAVRVPVGRWREITASPTYAAAILDRLVHNAHRIELTAESVRRTRGKQNQKA